MSEAPPHSWAMGAPAERLAWRRYWIRDTARGVAALVLHRLFAIMPVEAVSGLGGLLGVFIAKRDQVRSERARANILRLRPDLAGQVDAVVLRLWENIGRALAEVSLTSRLWKSPRIAIVGRENLELARARGRPRIFVALHTGDWELLGPALVREGEDLKQVYQHHQNRIRKRIAAEARSEFAQRLVEPTPVGLRQVIRHLSDRKTLVMFVDEKAGGIVQAPAFGRPRTLSGNIATTVRLALMTGALVIPVYLVRTRGCRFELRLGRPFELTGDHRREADLERGVARLDAEIAPLVLENLDQWVMLAELKLPD